MHVHDGHIPLLFAGSPNLVRAADGEQWRGLQANVGVSVVFLSLKG
jgi:hypothetical protein